MKRSCRSIVGTLAAMTLVGLASPTALAEEPTAPPAGDVVEAGVLARAVPEASVSATKSSTGHLLGGAGGLEAVLTVMALHERWAPPTLLPAGVDPELTRLGLDIVGPRGRDLPALAAAASTSFGFGGHNVALVFTRE